jgi:hypothetical protein
MNCGAPVQAVVRVAGTRWEAGWKVRPIPGVPYERIGPIGVDGKDDSERPEGLRGDFRPIVSQPYKQVFPGWCLDDPFTEQIDGTGQVAKTSSDGGPALWDGGAALLQ